MNGFYEPLLYEDKCNSTNSDETSIDISKESPEEFAEFISLKWTGKEKHTYAPNIVASTRWFNQINFWVQREILRHCQTNKRTGILSFMIRTAKKLVDFNNLYSAMSIVAALQVEAIYRLAKSWDGLGGRDRSHYRRLVDLFTQDANCRRQRDYMQASQLPGIPYLGLYLSDLTYTNVAHPRVAGERSQVWIAKIDAIVNTIARFQQSDYPFTVNRRIRAYLIAQHYVEELQKFAEEDNYHTSLALEPPPPRQSTPSTSNSNNNHDHSPLRRSLPRPACGVKQHARKLSLVNCSFEADAPPPVMNKPKQLIDCTTNDLDKSRLGPQSPPLGDGKPVTTNSHSTSANVVKPPDDGIVNLACHLLPPQSPGSKLTAFKPPLTANRQQKLDNNGTTGKLPSAFNGHGDRCQVKPVVDSAVVTPSHSSQQPNVITLPPKPAAPKTTLPVDWETSFTAAVIGCLGTDNGGGLYSNVKPVGVDTLITSTEAEMDPRDVVDDNQSTNHHHQSSPCQLPPPLPLLSFSGCTISVQLVFEGPLTRRLMSLPSKRRGSMLLTRLFNSSSSTALGNRNSPLPYTSSSQSSLASSLSATSSSFGRRLSLATTTTTEGDKPRQQLHKARKTAFSPWSPYWCSLLLLDGGLACSLIYFAPKSSGGGKKKKKAADRDQFEFNYCRVESLFNLSKSSSTADNEPSFDLSSRVTQALHSNRSPDCQSFLLSITNERVYRFRPLVVVNSQSTSVNGLSTTLRRLVGKRPSIDQQRQRGQSVPSWTASTSPTDDTRRLSSTSKEASMTSKNYCQDDPVAHAASQWLTALTYVLECGRRKLSSPTLFNNDQ